VHDPELERLTARVAALESDVAQLRAAVAAPATTTRLKAPTPETPAAATEKPPVHRADVETLVGGRGLLYVGALLIVVGAASFLKIAFDRGWIGPPMRVAIGILAAVVLIAGGNALRKRLHPYFADVLIGVGAAIAYLSLYGASTLFGLLPLPVVALGMVVVTATTCILAYRDDRQPLAYFGIAGGIVTPLLLGNQTPNLAVLYTYLAVLAAGSIALSELRGWRGVAILSLVGTALYWLEFAVFDGTAAPQNFADSLTAALAFYVLFASVTAVAALRGQPAGPWRAVIAMLDAAWFFFALPSFVGDRYATLAIVFLAIAAAHVFIGLRWNQRLQFWLATVALTFAIPPVCWSFSALFPSEGIVGAMHVAWIVEATVAGVLGARWKDRGMSILSGAIFAAVFLHTALVGVGLLDYGVARLIFNQQFFSLLAAAIGVAIVRRACRSEGFGGAGVLTFAKVAVSVLALLAVSPEAMRIGALLQPHNTAAGSNVALSITWALFGGTLIVLGIRDKDVALRWEGLALLGITVLKVFAVDLTDLDLVFRVVSALALGVVMLVLAYLYQSRLRAAKAGS
jgi:uncharacterized membrane protein